MSLLIFNLIIFVLGLCFGSFASVLISRILNQENGIIFGKSHCPNCKHQLSALDLIPVLSYLFNRGECKYCDQKISKIYPLLEITTAILFLIAFSILNNPELFSFLDLSKSNLVNFEFGSLIILIYLLILNFNLILIVFSDFIEKAIPNIFLYSWIFFSLLHTFFFWPTDWLNLLLAIVVILIFFGGQILISKGKWLGSGDLYFAFGMALLLGLEKTLLAIVLSYIFGSIISIILLSTKVLNKKSTLAFTPYLALGTLISFYFGNQIIAWYFNLNFFIF